MRTVAQKSGAAEPIGCALIILTSGPKRLALHAVGRQSEYTKGSMKIEALLTEAEISQEFAEAMEARDIPEKFFYWHPLSVRSWLALSHDVAYESRLHSWNLLVDDV